MIKILPLFIILLLVAGCAHIPRQESRISPKEVESRLNLAKMYLMEAEPRVALEELRLIEHEARNNPQLHFFLGVTYKLLNDHERSVRAYEKSVTLDPAYGDAWNNLGQARQASGDLEGSRRAYEQALALDGYMTPEFAAYNMASLLAEQGKFDQALAYSQLGIEKNRRYIPLYLQKAELLRRTGRSEEAVQVLEKGVLARPDSMHLRLMLAEEFIRVGRVHDARKWFLQIIEQDSVSDEAKTAAHYLEVLR